ncbi:hypothetical protein FUAX_10790 [Fulvitalea axinellae]|uniref:Uncharacterized protein n=1 Tax=Fulvitalea axinellae TaxID=1182444 RepID=A0AAU9CTC3_9BACT|nr:hypothetical protein FUAX_10790 [Fulvitalea axinellae]
MPELMPAASHFPEIDAMASGIRSLAEFFANATPEETKERTVFELMRSGWKTERFGDGALLEGSYRHGTSKRSLAFWSLSGDPVRRAELLTAAHFISKYGHCQGVVRLLFEETPAPHPQEIVDEYCSHRDPMAFFYAYNRSDDKHSFLVNLLSANDNHHAFRHAMQAAERLAGIEHVKYVNDTEFPADVMPWLLKLPSVGVGLSEDLMKDWGQDPMVLSVKFFVMLASLELKDWAM